MDSRPSAERPPDGTFEADPETERMLLAAIAQCHRGHTAPLSEFLAELRSRERVNVHGIKR